MIVSSAVIAIASVVILVGGVVAVADAWKARSEAVSAAGARERIVAELTFSSVIGWVVVAACAALLPSLWRSRLSGGDLALAAFVLGLAADRAAYLITRNRGTEAEPRLQQIAAIGTAVVAGGVAIGLAL